MWNASIASHLGPNRKTNFCWGGATAINRATFERLEIRDKWLGTLSDDFTLTRALHQFGHDIHFVPQALTASVEDCSWRELFEFTNRQMKITRVYSPNLWVLSFIGSGLFTTTLVTSLLIIIFSSKNDLPVAAALFTLTVVTIFSIGKSMFRLRAVQLVMPEFSKKLRRQTLPQITLWCLTPFVFLINCVAALLSRRIAWRGTVYEMISNRETKVVNKLAD
jgi:hypothetical protein